jgi:hypothetical protein
MISTQDLHATASASIRRVSARSRGRAHGPVTRLMSPSDLGQTLKPFVFLDLFDIDLHRSKIWFPHPPALRSCDHHCHH